MHKTVAVIGSGFAGLSAACYLAKEGFNVHVFEKNESIGGRARKFESDGFTFDMGPSWYWMPDVFERFFSDFGFQSKDFYELVRLSPSYRVFFEENDHIDLPSDKNELMELFDSIEPNSGQQLEAFLKDAEYKYQVGINKLVYKPSERISEFLENEILLGSIKLQLFGSISSLIRKYFKHPKIHQLLEFPVLFLGAKPKNTPALYSLMNYADMELGTWYPKGGMSKIIDAMTFIAKKHGVTFHLNSPVNFIPSMGKSALGVETPKGLFHADVVVAGADYHHVETQLLQTENRNYSLNYWSKRTMAPSSLLFYLGIDKKVENLDHHNLFFDADFENHAHEIYNDEKWPSDPLFYVCAPSKTDSTVAPKGCENLFVLMPIAPDLKDDNQTREKYFELLINRLETHTKSNIKEHIIYKRSFAVNDFKNEYNAYRGNAYGLANTLKQTAFLKPKMRNQKLNNLFYTGQLTIPGPGVPPALISGKVVSSLIINQEKTQVYESTI
ncbi:MAG: phytoene dehydrogenase [Crocinitomicaceae bacterium]|nr:phytoene dehydrogenase [Crocinitomicaceae bacterium]|tara:strand:- start:5673 stop:7169 length:1497 start_codon:yes stop_codon:yes gene_type:complete